ncbi:MAG: spore cortex-lytic enzyme [Clostridia bacterium]
MRKWKIIVATFVAIICIVSGVLLTIDTGSSEEAGNTAIMMQSETVIREIQTRLKKWGYYNGPITGYYGPLTKAAVIWFQKNNGLNAIGYIGPLTLAKMGINANMSNNNDLYLLAKIVYSESRGESYTGQVAVAAVVLNRVDNPNFPNTISGVIYQPWAFTAVQDGQFSLEPNTTAYQAAKDALNGWDPTYGSIYYYNASTASSKWIFSRPVTVVIGKHTFAT